MFFTAPVLANLFLEKPCLPDELEAAVRARLSFRCKVDLVPEGAFGDSAYKTRLAVTRA